MADVVMSLRDDPEYNGRKPKFGDQRYTLQFPLANGDTLILIGGRETMTTMRNLVLEELCDDETVGGN